jgi:ketosteroid isomerase-like protein
MHPNAELLTRFYTAMSKADAATMGDCYTDDATFSDPVFTDLKDAEVRKMWRMLCFRAKDFSVTFDGVEADDIHGKARWVARYLFSGTGNRVVNRIESSFEFRGGKIARQIDRFDLYAWMRQALGLKGLLLGWLPPVQDKVRQQAMGRLRTWKE